MNENLVRAQTAMENAQKFYDRREYFQGFAIKALIAHAEETEERIRELLIRQEDDDS